MGKKSAMAFSAVAPSGTSGPDARKGALEAEQETPDQHRQTDANGVVGRGFFPSGRFQQARNWKGKRAKSVEVGRDWVNLHPPAFPHLQTFCSFLCTAKQLRAQIQISYFVPNSNSNSDDGGFSFTSPSLAFLFVCRKEIHFSPTSQRSLLCFAHACHHSPSMQHLRLQTASLTPDVLLISPFRSEPCCTPFPLLEISCNS